MNTQTLPPECPPTAPARELAALRLDPRELGWHAGHPQGTWLLTEMLRWVRGWQAHRTRARMERAGFLFPPVHPRNHPLQDWHVFERWVTGRPVRWTYVEEYGEPLPPETLDGLALVRELDLVLARLSQRGVHIALRGSPPRALYIWLCDYVRRERFPYLCEEADLIVAGDTAADVVRAADAWEEEDRPSETALAYAVP